jgi:hypothetical protein
MLLRARGVSPPGAEGGTYPMLLRARLHSRSITGKVPRCARDEVIFGMKIYWIFTIFPSDGTPFRLRMNNR